MKIQTKLAVFSGAAALVLAVTGGDVAGASNDAANPGPSSHSASSPASAPAAAAPQPGGTHVELTGCIDGANC
ncbi:MAG: hypothetical protein JO236_01345 [Mycobacterium sp.]|uniref:hypothetical protein n=1 Tax=Mycobacterium sp. TaxID=1785 RepID=UPI001ED04BF7|nr:hypothetical protein [Mycobacterium sp.]MBW0016184.1 hypothetical protein [Mycobacterium sp.]